MTIAEHARAMVGEPRPAAIEEYLRHVDEDALTPLVNVFQACCYLTVAELGRRGDVRKASRNAGG